MKHSVTSPNPSQTNWGPTIQIYESMGAIPMQAIPMPVIHKMEQHGMITIKGEAVESIS